MRQPTVTYRGKAYRVGTDHTPMPLPDWFSPVLPVQWTETDTSAWTGAPDRDYIRAYRWRQRLGVIVSCCTYNDRRIWLHVSVSRFDGVLPTWEQMSLVKALFIGEERQALQVMPKASEHVNIHPGVLHLWHCLDGDGLPDFRAGGETI